MCVVHSGGLAQRARFSAWSVSHVTGNLSTNVASAVKAFDDAGWMHDITIW
jgi:hypothetical protein